MYRISGVRKIGRGEYALLLEDACTWTEVQRALTDLGDQGWETIRVTPGQFSQEAEEAHECGFSGVFGVQA